MSAEVQKCRQVHWSAPERMEGACEVRLVAVMVLNSAWASASQSSGRGVLLRCQLSSIPCFVFKRVLQVAVLGKERLQ